MVALKEALNVLAASKAAHVPAMQRRLVECAKRLREAPLLGGSDFLEQAYEAILSAESTATLVLSLLAKFPGQYALVDALLSREVVEVQAPARPAVQEYFGGEQLREMEQEEYVIAAVVQAPGSLATTDPQEQRLFARIREGEYRIATSFIEAE